MTTTAEPPVAYGLTEEHEALRASVRDFAETVVAPRAAEVDRTASYPWDVHEAPAQERPARPARPRGARRRGRGRHLDGDRHRGAVARRRQHRSDRRGRTSSARPACCCRAARSSRPATCPPWRPARRRSRTRCPSARPARTPRRCAPARVRDGDSYVLDGTKAWISQAGVSTHYTVMAVTEPGVGARGISAFVVHADDPGFSVGTPEHKMGIKGSPTCEVHFEGCRIPADRMIGAPGHRLQDRAGDPRPHPADHRRAGRRHRAGQPGRRDRLHQGAQAVRAGRSPTSRACSSCWPTWR